MKLLGGKPNIDKLIQTRDVEGLLKALGRKGDASVRRDAALGFGQLISPARLMTVLAGFESMVAEPARSLDDYDLKSGHESAGRMNLATSILKVIRDIMKLMGTSFDQRALAGLGKALTDEDPGVRVAAAEALAKRVDARGVGRYWLGQWRDIDFVASRMDLPRWEQGLERKDEIDPMILALNDRQEEVRTIAIGALRTLEDERAVSKLAALAEQDPSPEVREAAKEAVRSIRQSGMT